MIEINENNDFQTLTENISKVSNQNSEIENKDYERSQRALQLVQNSNNNTNINTSSTSEWNLLLNCLARIDYAVYNSIDFNIYHVVNDNDNPARPLTNQQLINSHNQLEAAYKNIYDKFIEQYNNQTINLFDTIKSYIQNIYLNRTVPDQNQEWVIIQSNNHTSEYETLDDITNHLINNIVEIKLDYSKFDNNARLLIQAMIDYFNIHYPVIMNISNMKLPAAVIEYICNYSIITTNESNLKIINAPDAIKAFNIILLSRYRTIPLLIYIENNLPDNRNIANVLRLPRQTIHLTVNGSIPISSLNELYNGEETYEQIQTKHPNITIDYVKDANQNLQSFINFLIDCYHSPNNLIISHVLNPYYAELFTVAVRLFNNYDFYKAINICKYLSARCDITDITSIYSMPDKSDTDNKYNIYNIYDNINHQLIDPGDKYSIFNVKPIIHVEKPKEPKPSTFDILYIETRKPKLPTVFKVLFVCGIIAAVVVAAKSYQLYHKVPEFNPSTIQESFTFHKLTFGDQTPHPHTNYINSKRRQHRVNQFKE